MFFIFLVFLGFSLVFSWVFIIFIEEKLSKIGLHRYMYARVKLMYAYRKFRYSILSKKSSTQYSLKKDSVLIKKGQVPRVAVYILKGNANIFYLDKRIGKIGPKSIIGPKDLLNNTLPSVTIKAEEGTLIKAFGKSELLEPDQLERFG